MAQNECVIQNDNTYAQRTDSLLYIAPMNGTLNRDEYMKWNTQGNAYCHTDTDNDVYICELLKNLQPLSEPYPFRIGFTGYVEMNTPVASNTFGKATDSLGRNVFIVGDMFLFQRYEKGNRYMYTTTWTNPTEQRDTYYRCVDQKAWRQIIKLL